MVLFQCVLFLLLLDFFVGETQNFDSEKGGGFFDSEKKHMGYERISCEMRIK